jgi:hypothetical protein
MAYKEKYLKYKSKYNALKNEMYGGDGDKSDTQSYTFDLYYYKIFNDNKNNNESKITITVPSKYIIKIEKIEPIKEDISFTNFVKIVKEIKEKMNKMMNQLKNDLQKDYASYDLITHNITDTYNIHILNLTNLDKKYIDFSEKLKEIITNITSKINTICTDSNNKKSNDNMSSIINQLNQLSQFKNIDFEKKTLEYMNNVIKNINKYISAYNTILQFKPITNFNDITIVKENININTYILNITGYMSFNINNKLIEPFFKFSSVSSDNSSNNIYKSFYIRIPNDNLLNLNLDNNMTFLNNIAEYLYYSDYLKFVATHEPKIPSLTKFQYDYIEQHYIKYIINKYNVKPDDKEHIIDLKSSYSQYNTPKYISKKDGIFGLFGEEYYIRSNYVY